MTTMNTPDSDRLFWLAIRRALLAMVAAIEARLDIPTRSR
jgi:hypothetical protein